MAVVSDARKIQQVIGNLVGNAVKFTEAGNVTVGITLKAEKQESGTLRIWVEDSGAGIPVSEQERIFEKFYQGQGGTLKTPGTGIGLALVKTFVECLGGQLELKSEPGKGSTFIVNLRVGLQPLAESGEAMPEDKRYEGIRILIVEDLEYNRTILEDFLGDLGCITESADNGRDGFEKARTGAFAVILLDWELPEKSGLEVARDLRADPAFPRDTLIVGMTAYATAEDQQACLDAGMDVFLSKPISHRQILEILDRVASRGALLEGLGLLSDMSQETDVNATLERWAGFHATYREELEEAIAGGDAQAIRKAAHRLLGHLRMLELTRLPGVVADLMTAAQAGDLRGVDQEWQVLAPLMEQLDREIREWMNKA
jgi:CheY-like chemotaxis protein/anti-sigma regulatory factor (Ser/Thr protein kinase)